jgi:hypothetical protein
MNAIYVMRRAFPKTGLRHPGVVRSDAELRERSTMVAELQRMLAAVCQVLKLPPLSLARQMNQVFEALF